MALLLDGQLQVEPGGPFYELLVTFVAASAGLTPVFDADHYPDFLAGAHGGFPGFASNPVTVDLGRIVGDVRRGAIGQSIADASLCCMLAAAAWASLDLDWKHPMWKHPEIQFFRHVRNAAAHGNRWHFRDGARAEPELPAGWGTFTIDHTLKGGKNPLHGKQCFAAMLGAGDLVRLLRDVEPLLK